MPPAKLTPAQKDEARALYLSDPNVSVDALAASYGVTREPMLRVLAGITRPRGGREQGTMTTERMIEMRRAGITWGQIGKQAGLSPSGVQRRVQRWEKRHEGAVPGADRDAADQAGS